MVSRVSIFLVCSTHFTHPAPNDNFFAVTFHNNFMANIIHTFPHIVTLGVRSFAFAYFPKNYKEKEYQLFLSQALVDVLT